MKFMIINRSRGARHGDGNIDHSKHGQVVMENALEKGHIEACYVLISGGHIIIAECENTHELAKLVRINPLFKSSDTEIIPIEDASHFLNEYHEGHKHFTGKEHLPT
jgi:hypothetical protein